MLSKPSTRLKWSAKSEAARLVCEEMDYRFDAGFVTVGIGTKGHILVDYTLAKPDEIGRLRDAVSARGWSFQAVAATDAPDPRPMTAERVQAANPLTGETDYDFWAEMQDERGEPATRAAYAQYVGKQVAASKAECARIARLNAAIRAASGAG